MRLMTLAAAASLGLAACVQGAAASTITETIDFTAQNFAAQNGHAVPTDPVTGSFTITLDPTLTYHDESVGITMNSLDVSFSGAPLFDYDPSFKFLVIGANFGANGVTWGTSDFSLALFLVDPNFQVPGFNYSVGGITDIFEAGDVSLTFSPPISTPLPGSVIMLLTSLGGLGSTGLLLARKAKATTLTA